MEDALAIEARRRIYDALLASPGIYFREMQRQLDVPTGALEYHLNYLEGKGMILASKGKGYTRYFVKDSLSERERKVMGALRSKNDRAVLMYLLINPCSGYEEIMEKCAMSRTSVAEAISRLTGMNLVGESRDERRNVYSVAENEQESVAKLLIAYKESFIDRTVDRFIKLWKEMK